MLDFYYHVPAAKLFFFSFICVFYQWILLWSQTFYFFINFAVPGHFGLEAVVNGYPAAVVQLDTNILKTKTACKRAAADAHQQHITSECLVLSSSSSLHSGGKKKTQNTAITAFSPLTTLPPLNITATNSPLFTQTSSLSLNTAELQSLYPCWR